MLTINKHSVGMVVILRAYHTLLLLIQRGIRYYCNDGINRRYGSIPIIQLRVASLTAVELETVAYSCLLTVKDQMVERWWMIRFDSSDVNSVNHFFIQ